MNATFTSSRRLATLLRAAVFGVAAVLAACGGRSDPPPPDVPISVGAAPAITTQPASATVTVGATATFTVVATGDAPLAYQWQRAGSAIAGATDASYTTPAAALADSGASFTVVVSNGVGSVTSDAATLTVSATAPVLTITQQPASTSVVAGASASFTVAGTCSAGTLGVKWQRSNAGAAFADITGATAATYTFTTTTADSGVQLRAVLDCGGQGATPSSAATLTVTAPGTVTLSAFPLVGLASALAQTGDAYGVDQMPDGSWVIAAGSRIERLSADLSSIALVAGGNVSGAADGPLGVGTVDGAQGIVHDSAGNLYVADTGNQLIRRIAPDGTLSTIAGAANAVGTSDGTGSAARFNNPVGIAIGPDGDLYVADTQNHRIRRVTTAGVVTTYAGSTQGFADAAAGSAKFDVPSGIAVAANGDVIVSDYSNSRIRRIVRAGNVAGAVETVAGTGAAIPPFPDGIGTAAVIRGPSGMVLRGNTVVVQDTVGLLRQIDLATQAVTTITGSRAFGGGYADGPPGQARLAGAGGVALAPNGGYLVTNPTVGGLELVSASGDVRTVHTSRAFGVVDGGTGVLAQMPLALYQSNNVGIPQAVTVDAAGNIVLVEGLAKDVRRISPSGVVTPVAGLVGSTGNGVDGVGSAAQFRSIGEGVTTNSAGVVYVADAFAVRRIGTDNTVTTLAGSRETSGAVDGVATTARFGNTAGLAVGPNGDVFVCDPNNRAVRRIDAAGNVTTYAGALGQSGNADGPIATARLQYPSSLAFEPDGSLLVADYGSIRRVSADGSSISTVFTLNFAAAAGKVVRAPDGSIYFGGDVSNLTSRGLYRLAPGASTPTGVVPYDNLGPHLGSGSDIRVNSIDDMALLGPHQLVVLTGGKMIIVAVP